MKKWTHKIKHFLQLNKGIIYSELRGESVWIGFQCGECGTIEGLHCAGKIIDHENPQLLN